MGLDIEVTFEGKTSGLHWNYHRIHVLRDYACQMVDAKDEDSPEARDHFPNLVWHSDAEGYYVGFLPSEWSYANHLWVGSTEGLYKELQRVSTHMLENHYEGEAKEVLIEFLKLFSDVEYCEENARHCLVTFS